MLTAYGNPILGFVRFAIRQLGRLGIGGGPNEDQSVQETGQWERIEGVGAAEGDAIDRDPLR